MALLEALGAETREETHLILFVILNFFPEVAQMSDVFVDKDDTMFLRCLFCVLCT